MDLSTAKDFTLGSQVSTWGFPAGYSGRAPLLSVGYLAGLEALRTKSGVIVEQWVVNAAFNRGNSGGPLLSIDDATVIGVVSSKIAPISQSAKSALDALSSQRSGFSYTRTHPDGTQEQLSEGQIVAEILNELRAQVQLVVGMATKIDDLKSFLLANGVTGI
jgi:S1-C subfamily serine protease